MVEFFIDSTKVTIAHADTVRLMLDSVKVSLQSSPTQSSEWLVVVKDVTLVVTALLGVLAGLVATIVQYRTTTRALKADLLSNSRLKWIDLLRDLLSEYISLSLLLLNQRDEGQLGTEDWQQNRIRLHFLLAKIRLLIIPNNEEDHKLLIKECDKILRMILNEKKPANEVGNVVGEIIKLSQVILKREWERVKMFE